MRVCVCAYHPVLLGRAPHASSTEKKRAAPAARVHPVPRAAKHFRHVLPAPSERDGKGGHATKTGESCRFRLVQPLSADTAAPPVSWFHRALERDCDIPRHRNDDDLPAEHTLAFAIMHTDAYKAAVA